MLNNSTPLLILSYVTLEEYSTCVFISHHCHFRSSYQTIQKEEKVGVTGDFLQAWTPLYHGRIKWLYMPINLLFGWSDIYNGLRHYEAVTVVCIEFAWREGDRCLISYFQSSNAEFVRGCTSFTLLVMLQYNILLIHDLMRMIFNRAL